MAGCRVVGLPLTGSWPLKKSSTPDYAAEAGSFTPSNPPCADSMYTDEERANPFFSRVFRGSLVFGTAEEGIDHGIDGIHGKKTVDSALSA